MASDTLSVIIPTWNERENIIPLLEELGAVLDGRNLELVVVDDSSPDGTAEAVEAYARTHAGVRLLRRPGKLGLSSAVLDGARFARGRYLVMMDADFSHSPALVPVLVAKLEEGYMVAVASRYVPGGGIQGWPRRRRLSSRVAILFARIILGLKTKDLTSGFAAFQRYSLTELPTRFSARGFKLLAEVLSVWPGLRVAEVPYLFTDRQHGKSKFGMVEVLRFMGLCLRLRLYRLGHSGRPKTPVPTGTS